VIEMAAGVCRDEPKPDRRHGRRAASCNCCIPGLHAQTSGAIGQHTQTGVHLSAASKNRGNVREANA
jgi:hypothetical protein